MGLYPLSILEWHSKFDIYKYMDLRHFLGKTFHLKLERKVEMKQHLNRHIDTHKVEFKNFYRKDRTNNCDGVTENHHPE